jgi:hypothetical protein
MTTIVSGSEGITLPDNSQIATYPQGWRKPELQKRFNEAFDLRDGRIYWKINTNKSKNFVGKEAGCRTSNSYGSVNLDGVQYCIHKVIFCMVHGTMPDQVDHIDGNRQNHRIENLRPASNAENGMNKPAQSNNKTGIKNVCWNSTHRKWAVQVQAYGRRVFSKLFDSLELAELAAEEARNKYHGEFARSA